MLILANINFAARYHNIKIKIKLTMTKNYLFTNDWISGFTQSDGSFVISFENKNNGIPIRPRPVFNLTQSINELEMFIALQKYLGVVKKIEIM